MFDFAGFFRFLRLWCFRLAWTPRRALVASAFVLFVPLELIVHTALFADELLYGRYRRRVVREPVFITGNPRSGTTFLHRLLAEDTQRFSTMRMWEILFAPSIVQRRIVGAVVRLEHGLGAPISRLWQRVERRWAAINVMHRVSLNAPEEDDYLLLHAWAALTAGLSAGLLEEARPYTFFDTALPALERARIMRFYRRCVQRHLVGDPRQYLAKNPALCPKIGSLLEEFPDARIVYLVRNPLEAIPSYVSMMDYSWGAVGIAGGRDALREYLLEMAAHWYRYPLERLARAPAERYTIVRYDDLVRDPEATVRKIYGHFGWETDLSFAAVLHAEAERAGRFRSRHDYELEQLGLSRERIIDGFGDIIERFGFETGAGTTVQDASASGRAGAGPAASSPESSAPSGSAASGSAIR